MNFSWKLINYSWNNRIFLKVDLINNISWNSIINFLTINKFSWPLNTYWKKCQRSKSQVKAKDMELSAFFECGFFSTPSRNRRGVIFSLQFACVWVSVCLSVCVRLCLWTKFQQNESTDLHAFFAKQKGSKVKVTMT